MRRRGGASSWPWGYWGSKAAEMQPRYYDMTWTLMQAGL